MRKVSVIQRIVVSFAFFLAATSVVLGCSYDLYPDPPTEYVVSRTKTVFLGTLLQKNFRELKRDGYRFRVHSLVFRIDQGFKGQAGDSYTYEAWEKLSRRDSCDEDPKEMKVGEQWVIFDGYDEGTGMRRFVRYPQFLNWRFLPDDGDSCERLSLVKTAADSPASTFHGELEMSFFDGPPSAERGIRVELRDATGSEVLRTSEITKGQFKFVDLMPGTYVVRIRASKKERIKYPTEKEMQRSHDGTHFFADFPISISAQRPEFEDFVIDTY